MELSNALAVFAVDILQRFTGSVVEERFEEENESGSERNHDPVDGGEAEMSVLLSPPTQQNVFARGDPIDSVYEEYGNPDPIHNPLGWKQNRPSFTKSVLQCTRAAMEIILLGGILLGFLTVGLLYLDLNTFDYCYWKRPSNTLFVKQNKGLHYASMIVKILGIYSTPLMLLLTVFKWKEVKELNLLYLTLLLAFTEIICHFVFIVLELHSPLVNIPASIWSLYIVITSYIIGKKHSPRSTVNAIKVAFKLCAQFVFLVPTTLVFVLYVWPWFAEQHGAVKAALVSVFPLSLLPAKVIPRHCAIHSRSLIHPGRSFVLVVISYGGSSVVFRLMQAEMDSFKLFVALSIGDGVAHVLERSTILLRDYIWENMISRCITLELPRNRSYRSPRSQRLAADMSIQDMLFASVALVTAVATSQLYRIVYQDLRPDEATDILIEFFQRVLTGLGIMFIFNVLVVLLLTRVMNVPILRVWKQNWKLHCFVTAVVSLLIIFYFTHFAVRFVGESYDHESLYATRDFRLINCTVPFRFHH